MIKEYCSMVKVQHSINIGQKHNKKNKMLLTLKYYHDTINMNTGKIDY